MGRDRLQAAAREADQELSEAYGLDIEYFQYNLDADSWREVLPVDSAYIEVEQHDWEDTVEAYRNLFLSNGFYKHTYGESLGVSTEN